LEQTCKNCVWKSKAVYYQQYVKNLQLGILPVTYADFIRKNHPHLGHTKKCGVQCELFPPPMHALANEQDQRVVRAPKLEATGSKDVPQCVIRCCPHLKMSNITT